MAGAPDMLEPGAKFEVYLKSAGSYATQKPPSGSHHDRLRRQSDDEVLPYGTYTVHQGRGRRRAVSLSPISTSL